MFVVGFARSGTSALTRVLSLCGAALPPRLFGAVKKHPAGYWEPREAHYLNGPFLRRHRSAGFDLTLRLQAEGAFDANEEAACIAKIRAYLTTLPAAPVVVIKDPKITVLSGMWFEAARQAGFDPMAVIAVRHPHESIESTTAAAGTSPEFGGALWLKYSLLAERNTRGLPRVFVEYANLMSDWRHEMKRISAALAIDLDTQEEPAIDEFLAPALRHHLHSGPVNEFLGSDWISATYEALSAAARDDPLDQSALDRVFETYRVSEHGFRTAFEDFHRLHRLWRLVPISMVKVFLEANAIARRRNSTWA
ncbi:sulfotransferase family protein [Mycobacterium sp. E2327]|uniref:sulfotransferase family protein n=1 Tax=Mycobacterium sp. E2327 TaxID=1834132 RepID=UPI0009EE14B1|nr:sulfotransferase [Mycobacterium sp. E2327]